MCVGGEAKTPAAAVGVRVGSHSDLESSFGAGGLQPLIKKIPASCVRTKIKCLQHLNHQRAHSIDSRFADAQDAVGEQAQLSILDRE